MGSHSINLQQVYLGNYRHHSPDTSERAEVRILELASVPMLATVGRFLVGDTVRL